MSTEIRLLLRIINLSILGTLFTLLLGCGQTGPLYLPSDCPPETQHESIDDHLPPVTRRLPKIP